MKYIKYQILAGKSKIRALGPINVNLALMSTLRLIINYTSTITLKGLEKILKSIEKRAGT
tara:strand:+ start:581 stop:760 length:180 start_codon:yes stop_codon:yes gene_type:complete